MKFSRFERAVFEAIPGWSGPEKYDHYSSHYEIYSSWLNIVGEAKGGCLRVGG